MSSFALFLLCVHACLVQNVFSHCYDATPMDYDPAKGPYGYGAHIPPAPFGVAPIAVELGGLRAPIELGAYGGTGVGDVAVAGEMPVAGTTLVNGEVPILGAVRFAGDLPARGTVIVSGSCGCGCNSGPYYY